MEKPQKGNQNIYYEMYNQSINPLTREQFWLEQSKEISWYKPPSKNINSEDILNKANAPFYQWFPNVELNVCYNCVDRHIHNGFENSPALIYESYYLNKVETLTYTDLYIRVNQLAYILRKHGVKKGDIVIIYMPMIPEGIISMLACCRIGAIHNVVFGGFAAAELAERIVDSQAKFIITSSCGIEPRRKIPYYPIVQKAIELSKWNDTKILWMQRYDAWYVQDLDIIRKNTIICNDELNNLKNKKFDEYYIQPVPVKGKDIFFLLYTSGTSGMPKGIVRDNASIVTINFTMKYIMNIHARDVCFSTSDIGWIVGHIFMVYGPLLRAATTTIFEGKPIKTPDSGKCWEIIQKFKVKTFYTSPTALRAIRQEDPNYSLMHKYEVSSLESIHVCGERCDPETFRWIRDGFRNKTINDQWWQTESGWPIGCNNLGIYTFPNIEPGTSGPPMMGFKIKVMDEEYKQELPINKTGKICIELPLPPGFMSTWYNNNAAFWERYITSDNKYYISGDMGHKDANGFICIFGRNDDMIKVAGHRLSTGKIEEVISKVKHVSECAVVSMRDKLKGEIPYGFIVLDNQGDHISSQRVKDECMWKVIENIGRICAMKDILIVKNLPKTRSGKIIRSVLKAIVNGDNWYIPPTIEDRKVIGEIWTKISKVKL